MNFRDIDEQPLRAQTWLASKDVEMAFTFVPHSRSRYADGDLCLNWIVTIGAGNQTLTVDYMQGIGHLPGFRHGDRSIAYHELVKAACETGQRQRDGHGLSIGMIANPAPVDVLCSLCVDADVIEYATFEEWAEDYGYDTDSRDAEKTYNACLSHALKLRQMFDLDEMRAAFEDF